MTDHDYSYVCEISPPSVRGPLTTGPQFMVCLGLVAGYFICYGTSNIPSSLSWRLPFIILTGLAAFFVAATLLFLPHSPRWLLLQGREAEADAAWETLGVNIEDRQIIEAELEEGVAVNSYSADPGVTDVVVEKQVEEEARFMDLFKEDVRGRTFLAVFLMGFLQLSGIDAVLYVGIQFRLSMFLTNHLVRSYSLPTSRPYLQRRVFFRLRYHWRCARCSICSRSPSCRQMGSPHEYHCRRPRSHDHHYANWNPIRQQRRAALTGSSSLGRHHLYLLVCCILRNHMGREHQSVRAGNTASEDARKSYSAGAWIQLGVQLVRGIHLSGFVR